MSSGPPLYDLLAIVPARAGSRGVIGKNMREVAGRPLVSHTVDALRMAGVSRIVVSSDDEQVLAWATMHGVEVIERPSELATAEATISDVAVSVVQTLGWDGIVGIFQPTSPLRSSSSIRGAIEAFNMTDSDSLASVVADSHLYWFDAEGEGTDGAAPLFRERSNRQFATQRLYRETGAIQLVTASSLLTHNSVVTPKHQLFEIDEHEAEDIDTPEQLAQIRRRAIQGLIIFRLTANARVGSGHLHHCLQLAEHLDVFEIHFLLKECDEFAVQHLRSRGWSCRFETDLASDLRLLGGAGSNVLVNDVLDTTAEDVLVARSEGYRVVCIEDLGPGARHADWVVNALYPAPGVPSDRLATGARYATLRSEFLGLPEKVIRRSPERILVTFGGTDPGHLAQRVADSLASQVSCQIVVVCGPASPTIKEHGNIRVKRDVKNMAEEMWLSDLVITAAGRTVHEAASVGTPVIAIAQSAREATHSHLGIATGVVFMGLGVLTSDEQIRDVTVRLLGDHALRMELSERLRRSIDGLGAQRISHTIESIMRGLQ